MGNYQVNCKCEPQKTNSYGNTTAIPDGWKRPGDCTTKLLKEAKAKGLLVGVIEGWGGSNKYPKPVINNYCCPHYFEAHVNYRREKQEKQKRLEEKRKTPQYIASKEKREQKLTEKFLKAQLDWQNWMKSKVHNEELLNIFKYSTVGSNLVVDLINELNDINEAHPSWLRQVYTALHENYIRKGVYWSYRRGETELDFYQVCCMARSAYLRHNETDYDEVLSSGMYVDYEDLKREKTLEALYG